MPHLANPWFLALFLVLAPLLWWRRRGGAAVRFPTQTGLVNLTTLRARLARHGGLILRGLALASLIVALSGPRWPDASTRIETEGIAIMVLVDVSKSMDQDDFEWQKRKISRLEAVKRVVRLFIKGEAVTGSADGTDTGSFAGRPNDLIGLITFAHRPETTCPLTLSHSVLLGMIDDEKVRTTPDEAETNLSDPVALALQRLRDAGPRRKIIVLLTDGEHNVEPTASGWSPREAAEVAGSLGIPLYTLDAGRPSEAEKKDDERAGAIESLVEMAARSKGKYFQTRDTPAMLDAWHAIDNLERSEIQSFQYRRYFEAYPWFGAAAFVLYLFTMILEMTWWRRLP